MNANQKTITSILGILLIVSVVGNVYFFQKLQENNQHSFSNNVVTSSAAFKASGFKNEEVMFFDGKQYRSYSTSTPLSEGDVRAMREEMKREFERINEFFRRQDELFQSLWGF